MKSFSRNNERMWVENKLEPNVHNYTKRIAKDLFLFNAP